MVVGVAAAGRLRACTGVAHGHAAWQWAGGVSGAITSHRQHAAALLACAGAWQQ